MKTPFGKSSYLSQVRKLRKMATVAVAQYPIQVKAIHFINHGENATFRIDTKKGSFLLRIHRGGYHTEQAILEELNWLKKLEKKSALTAPRPLLSRGKRLVELITTEDLPLGRHCCLFHWIEGSFIFKSLNPAHMFKLGQGSKNNHSCPRTRF